MPHRYAPGAGIALAIALGACAGARPGPSCPQPSSSCQGPCCDSAHVCVDVVCEGILFGCRQLGNGRFEWIPNVSSCTVDAGAPHDGPLHDGPRLDSQACSSAACTACPGICGPNAECRDGKCRCLGQWLDQNGSWTDGCELLSPNCSPSNCNECSHAYCGRRADCMQGKCKCVTTGYYNCDTVWNSNGCECWAGCNGTSCQ